MHPTAGAAGQRLQTPRMVAASHISLRAVGCAVEGGTPWLVGQGDYTLPCLLSKVLLTDPHPVSVLRGRDWGILGQSVGAGLAGGPSLGLAQAVVQDLG